MKQPRSEKGSQGRRRSVEHAQLSSWHFASKRTVNDINDLKEINAVGERFSKTHDPADAQLLLEAFHNYLLKYMGLLTTGKVAAEGSLSRYIPADTRRFLSLFMTPGVRHTFDEFARTADRLPNAFLWMSADDIYNELALIFLELANKFDGRGGFVGFIQFRFAWAVKARLFQVQKDPLNFSMVAEQPSPTVPAAPGIQREDLLPAAGRPHVAPNVLLGFKLTPVFITSPPPPFGEIWTAVQRAIFYHRYADEMSDTAIAEHLCIGGGSSAVRAELAAAVAKFKKFCPHG